MKELLRELFLIMEDNISDSKERYNIYQQFISHLFEVDNEILEYLLDNNEEFSDAYQDYVAEMEAEEEE